MDKYEERKRVLKMHLKKLLVHGFNYNKWREVSLLAERERKNQETNREKVREREANRDCFREENSDASVRPNHMIHRPCLLFL